MTVKINTEKCGNISNCPGDGLCIMICEKSALIDDNGNLKVVNENCDDCDLCIVNCPNEAIEKV